MGSIDTPVRLDLNNPVFQEHLSCLQKQDRNAAIDTLRKIRLLTWGQLYRDNGLKWEKIVSVKPPHGIDAIYSMRITQSRRCTAYRDGDFMRFLTVAGRFVCTEEPPIAAPLHRDGTVYDSWGTKQPC
jgi:hypothetical protein